MKRTSLIAVVLACSASGQQLTSPIGYLNREGDSGLAEPVSMRVGRIQQIDSTVRGKSFKIDSISLRRDGNPFQDLERGPATIEVSLTLGVGDVTQLSSTFSKNYLSPPVKVLDKVTIQLPDWKQPYDQVPTPFDLKIPLPQPWAFDGSGDLVWELEFENNTSIATGIADAVNHEVGAIVFDDKGPGCNQPLLSRRMRTWSRIEAKGLNFVWDVGIYAGPANAPGVLLVGVGPVPPGPRPPCMPDPTTIIYPFPIFDIPLGSTNAAGWSRISVNWPYDPAAVGTNVLIQSAALDQNFFYGFSFGNWGDQQLPAERKDLETALLIATDNGSTIANRLVKGGLVVGIN